ncbi:MAG: LCP family protein [Clostridia bacterium]|nr:LCP family protein [Clostridia bacterium]
MAGKGNRRSLKALIFLAVLLVLALGGYLVGRYFEEHSVKETRSQMTEGFGKFEEKIYKGDTYYKKTGLTTLLLMGVDRQSEGAQYLYRDGGQADFLLLLVIDHEGKTVRQLQVERDTIARVHVLTILGQEGGHMNMQICLSHGYGANQRECAENTIEAVSHYLDNLGIDLFMAVDYSAVATINDMLGGVTVTLKDDFGTPDMRAGQTLRLQGKQAETFVRSRMSVGDGTNASRQLRQREWLDGAKALMREKLDADPNFFGSMLDAMGDRLVTNASRGRLINEFNAAFGYEQTEVEQIPGEYSIGRDGFMEYHTAPDDVTQWVLKAAYRPAKNEEQE